MVMGFPEFDDGPKRAKDYTRNEVVSQPVEPVELETPVKSSQYKEKENKMDSVVSKFGIPYKSILGFLSVFVGQLLARSTVNDIPVLPENVSGWFSLLGGSFVAAAVIYFKSNVYTDTQINRKIAAAERKHL